MTSKIALIIGSTRQPRVGIFMANYVASLLKPLSGAPVDIIDLADQKLPIFDEAKSPFSRPKEDPTPHYEHEHTRNWSTLIKQYSGFIFVTPEYNGSVPAGLKNALDCLGHEWGGKPAGIVSYGGHGGDKAAGHLRDILKVLRIKTVPTSAEFKTSRNTLTDQLESHQFPASDIAAWNDAGAEKKVEQLYAEVSEALQASS